MTGDRRAREEERDESIKSKGVRIKYKNKQQSKKKTKKKNERQHTKQRPRNG